MLRRLRQLHRYAGIFLMLLLVSSSLTGLMLGWKKDAAILQPPTQKGTTGELREWRPLYEVRQSAVAALGNHLGRAGADFEIDRFDARPDKGIVKVRFVEGAWEVQVDPATLQVRSIGRRHADWIEKVHDLSIISEPVKLISMNVLGLGMLFLSLSGLWLWYGPLRMRRQKGH